MSLQYPRYPTGPPFTQAEWNWHRLGWVPATLLDDWKEGGCEVGRR